MKRHSYTKLLFLSAGAAIGCQEANAGISDAINDYFTFREEQKELIRPNYTLPPKHVVVPYYEEQNARAWSNYYTREDLAPQTNMDDSSMVMRPNLKPFKEEERSRHLSHLAPQKNSHFSGHNDRLAVHHPQALGFEAIEKRDHLNRIQNLEGNVFIGDPGSGPHLNYNAGSNVGKKVQIGEPRPMWNEDSPKNYANARPGDYDYQRQPIAERSRETYTQNIERANGYETSSKKTFADVTIGTPVRNNLPTEYTVQKNDTLSGISNKDQIYGDWKLWPIIYDANKSQISDPDLIHPRQQLGIPRDYSPQDSNSAQQRAIAKHPPYSFYDGK